MLTKKQKEIRMMTNEQTIKGKQGIESSIRDILLKYKGIISMSGLSKITGINERQLSHYVQGGSKPRKAQEEKIIQGLKKLGEELTQLDFK